MSRGWIPAAALFLALPAGAATVSVAKEAGGWVLRVDGQPFIVQGIAYTPEKVGEDPNTASLRSWQYVDDNRNGVLDSPYESYVDANGNNLQDPAEPTIGDWALLRDMGANTIRLYHHPSNDASVQAGYGGNASNLLQYNHAPEKASLRDLHDRYGLFVAVGDFFGAYRIGSGASQSAQTDYSDATQKSRILASVQQMVTDYKDESFTLMYVLGNENNLTSLTFTNAQANPAAFASVVGDAVALIKAQDTKHPVAIDLGDDTVGNLAAIYAQLKALPANKQPDILGANVYRGPNSFGTFFSDAADNTNGWDKPVVFTEYGDPAAHFTGSGASRDLDEANQATILTNAWNAIVANEAGGSGADNSIGGMAYEWLDNWWQAGGASVHTIVGTGGFENEWHGFASQGAGFQSPFLRKLRQVYTAYQTLWAPAGRTVPAAGGRFLYPYAGSYAYLDVPDGALPAGTVVTLASTGSFPSAPGNTLDFVPTGAGAQITTSNGAQPSKTMTVYLPFAHNNGAYIIARYDTAHDKWITLPTRRDSSGVLVAQTDHLSLFQVMQVTPAATIARAVAFPNPARPARGQNGITFASVPPGASVKLFTASGELVRELEADNTGVAFWDLENRDSRAAASGVYFALIDGPGGQETIKVGVQR